MDSSSSVIWGCVACNRPMEDLYILPCQHRFCDSCINSWLVIYIDNYRGNGGRIPCQICWAIWQLPVSGLEALKQNYNVHMLQSQLRDFTMATDDDSTSSPSNSHHPSAVNSNYTHVDNDISDAQNNTDYFVSAHSYQNEGIPNIIISPVSQETALMGTDSTMHQNDTELENAESHGAAVIQENVISSTRYFHGTNPGGPSIGVCRRIEHYHDYDMYGAGHYC